MNHEFAFKNHFGKETIDKMKDYLSSIGEKTFPSYEAMTDDEAHDVSIRYSYYHMLEKVKSMNLSKDELDISRYGRYDDVSKSDFYGLMYYANGGFDD